MSESKWIDFWLNTSVFSGWIRSREKWVKIVKGGYCGSLKSLLRLKSHRSSNFLDFGKGPKYIERLTLGAWAKKNNIDLTI